MRMRGALGLAVVLGGLAGCRSLPEKPDPPHRYFEHPDRFVEVSDKALYVRPLKVRYKDVGTGEGPPLVLVHGLQTSSYSWRYNLERLAKDRRVIALDLVGSGLTDHPRDFGYSPQRIAHFLDAFRRALKIERWDVVGNSLGGVYTAVYAAQYPEAVRRLVIIHAPGFVEEGPFFGLEQMRRGRVPELVSAFFGPWMIREYLLYHRPNLKSEEEIEQYSLPFADAEGKAAFWHIVREGLAPELVGQLPGVLSKIKAKTLLIWSTSDALIPPWTGHRWEQSIPGARLEWVPESSHFPHVEAPVTTERLILGFLREEQDPTNAPVTAPATQDADVPTPP